MVLPSERSPLLNSLTRSASSTDANDQSSQESSHMHMHNPHGQNCHQRRLRLSLSAFIIGFVAFVAMLLLLERRFDDKLNRGTVNLQLFPGGAATPSSLPLLDEPLVAAGNNDSKTETDMETAAVYSNMTFAELGAHLIQQHYAASLKVIDTVFVDSVEPDEMALPRKVLLKTRDLLDVFSPIYPAASSSVINHNHNNNNNNNNNNKQHVFDLWTRLRWEVAKGYQIVGEFLDLNHAHINFTKADSDRLRDDILEWKANFTIFRQDHPEIPTFLASPFQDVCFHHFKESRFFWLDTPKEMLPKGTSRVTPVLQRLAIHQSRLALQYLDETMQFQRIMANHTPQEQLERQETFHNLRKTLRAICDEVEVIGAGVFVSPSSPSLLDAEFALLAKARGVLGDLNDLWTAHDFYVQRNQMYVEQERLARAVDTAFVDFQQWAQDKDLEGALLSVMEVMTGSSVKNGFTRKTKSLANFLIMVKQYPTRSIVIGNAAGDADSVISAIALAYVETYSPVPVTLTRKTPIVSISKREFRQRRPEINLLLELAGLSDPAKDLVFVTSSVFESEKERKVHVTLVDHNAIENKFRDRNWEVIEIIDHHEDQRLYQDAVPRVVAYDSGTALAASACTLVAERMIQLWEPPYPASISLLLMGVILLDSVNLSQEAGKVTQRDIDAVQKLLNQVDWQTLPKASQYAIGIHDDDKDSPERPDTNLLFSLLQRTKYSPGFWDAMSVQSGLQYDYKEFHYKQGVFGISTVLMPMGDFLHKDKLVPSIQQFLQESNIDLLGIMFAYEEEGHLKRELMICSDGEPPMEMVQLDEQLITSSLDLEETPGLDAFKYFDAAGLHALFFNQQNVAASRKQIGPLLRECLDNVAS